MIRRRLANGLRVLVDELPGCARVATSLHYGVGFRTEPPGMEGFAHLSEHLMFRGSRNFPRGTFYDHVFTAAGEAGGTTHQDYTEYFQIGPSSSLGQILFSEADRMRAPVFTPDSIAEQLAGVADEIRMATLERRYGGFPWPLLPGVLFDAHANSHDGYGDIERLRNITPADCYAFFNAHYAPSNAVLTIVGGVDAEYALALGEEYFGDVRDRPVAPPVDLAEPALPGDRWVNCTEPGITRTAVALGLVLPDPALDLPRHLAHQVLATLVPRHLSGPPRWPAVDIGCGFFGPLDARAPDVMVLVAPLLDGVTPERFVERVTGTFSALASRRDLGSTVCLALESLVAGHYRRYTEPQTRARALSRWEILFDRAELLDELPALLRAITHDDIRAAAADVAQAPKAVVVMQPGTHRTRPAPPPVPPADEIVRAWPGPPRGETYGAERSVRAPTGTHRPQTRDHLRMPRFADLTQEVLGERGRLVVLRDPRAEIAQLRVRWPLGHHGVANFRRTQELATALPIITGCHQRTSALGGTLSLDTDGQWLDLTSDAPVGALRSWLDVLAGLLDVRVPDTGDVGRHEGVRPREPEPFVLGDAAWRRQQLAGEQSAPPERTLAQLVSPGVVTIVVADKDPAEVGAIVCRALGRAGFEVGAAASLASGPEPAAPIVAVAQDTVREEHLTLHRTRPAMEAEDLGLYVATGLLGGYYNSRLVSRIARRGGYLACCGRDQFLGMSRSYVRVVVGQDLLGAAVADVMTEIAGLATDPPGAAEIAAARRYCSAQALSLFDTPTIEADALCRSISRGSEIHAIETLPTRLAEVLDATVAAASADLFTTGPDSAIVVGRSRAEHVAEALQAAGPA